MNKIIYFSVLFFFFLSTNGQDIKEYSGDFEDGKATYNYYENEQMDRILHGKFIYWGAIYELKGNFLHGRKNGKWVISAKNKEFSNWAIAIKLNTIASGFYKDGALDGNWSYENTIEFISDIGNKDIENAVATFKDNHFVGQVTYYTNYPKDYNVNGKFDNNGIMDSTWIFKNDNEKDEIRFYKGVAYWRLYNNIQTGEKKIFCDSSTFVREFWQNYDTLTKTSIVNKKVYYPDTVLINSKFRVFDDDGFYAENRRRNVIKIADPRFSDVSNPTCFWLDDDISLFSAGAIANPLYYYQKGSIYPYGLQIIINDCYENSDCYKNLKNRELEQKEK